MVTYGYHYLYICLHLVRFDGTINVGTYTIHGTMGYSGGVSLHFAT